MKYSKIPKKSIQVFVLTLLMIISYISFIGGYSALLILEDEDNIDLNVGFIGNPIVNPVSFEIEVKLTINNDGYTDLEDLTIEMELLMIYHQQNLDVDNDGLSDPVELVIFDDDESFDAIKAGEEETNSIVIKYEDLTGVIWSDLQLYGDPAYDIIFKAETLVISAKYSYNLLSFIVEFEDIDLGIFYF